MKILEVVGDEYNKLTSPIKKALEKDLTKMALHENLMRQNQPAGTDLSEICDESVQNDGINLVLEGQDRTSGTQCNSLFNTVCTMSQLQGSKWVFTKNSEKYVRHRRLLPAHIGHWDPWKFHVVQKWAP